MFLGRSCGRRDPGVWESEDHNVDSSSAEPNAVQLANWDGSVGDIWTTHADRFDEGVAAYREEFLTAAAIGETAAVLDIGCGAGQTMLDAARRATAGAVVGVDLSLGLLELARLRARDQQWTT